MQRDFLRKMVVTAVLFFSATASYAHQFEVDGIFYDRNEDGTTVSVTFKGISNETNNNSFPNEYSGSVTIPSSVTYSGTTYLVTSIGYRAFYDCSSLTSVEIPSSITSIGNYAFYDCSSLTSVNIPNSVISIGDGAFYGCKALTSAVIPNSVTSIGDYAFQDCSSLTSLEIPESVTFIGARAFSNAAFYFNIPNGLVYFGNVLYEYKGKMPSGSKITIKYGTTSISPNAFWGCKGLVSVKIPNTVTSIGKKAFSGCWYLTSVEIPNSVTSISDGTFEDCSSLTSVVIPNSVSSIGDYAFNFCSGLSSVSIPSSVTSIGDYAFEYCSKLESVMIPNSITFIGDGAFKDSPFYENMSDGLIYLANVLYEYKGTMPSGTGIYIKNGTTSISPRAFSGCGGMRTVTIPSSVTSIGDYAFSGCSGLSSVSIPSSVTSIGDGAFERCSGLTSFVIPNSVTSISTYAFNGCSALTSIDIPNNVTFIGKGAFSGCSALTSIDIPNNVTFIGNGAFSGCSALTSMDIPDSVTSIDSNAFFECTGLKSVKLGNSIATIGWTAFYQCSNLTSVVIPNSVTSIDRKAFYLCKKLESVEVGNSATFISDYAFYESDSLKIVFYNAKKCEGDDYSVFSSYKTNATYVIGKEVEQIGRRIFDVDFYSSSDKQIKFVSHKKTPPVIMSNTINSHVKSIPLYIPNGTYAKYWAADFWNEFSDIREINNPVTKIEVNKSFFNLENNNTVKLTATITPSNATLNDIYWSSDEPTIASVDQNGNVTGLQNGMATITAMAIDGSEVKATCLVSVGELIAESLTLNPSKLSVAVNGTAKIAPVIAPEGIPFSTLEWSISDEDVAVYRSNTDGTITVLGVADGVATITCRTTDISKLVATCEVSVGAGAVESIEADAVAVRGENGVIRIEGAEDAKVEVYNAAGVCIYSGTATEIPVPQRGLYVVKVAGRATKIAL